MGGAGGGSPDMGSMLQMLQQPGVQQAMQSLMAQPQVMQSMINSNPQLRAMADQNPQVRCAQQPALPANMPAALHVHSCLLARCYKLVQAVI